jgi:5-methyltetrahydropteroyltriglutamate--homocysteine methyltransferase
MTDAEQQIRTTSMGSLPRSLAVTGALARRAASEPGDTDEVITAAVAGMVRMQVDAGISLIGNGEASREGYITYVRDRLTGLDGTGHVDLPCTDVEPFPAHMARVMGQLPPLPACTGPVAYQGIAVNSEIEDLLLALQHAGRAARDGFLSAVTPGTIAMFVANRFCPTSQTLAGRRPLVSR